MSGITFLKHLSFRLALALTGSAAALPVAAQAQPSGDDLQVVAKAIGFLVRRPAEPVTVALVFSPNADGSRRAAEQLTAELGTYRKIDSLTITPRLVSTRNLNDLNGAAVAFIMAGLEAEYATIFEATRSRRILSASIDAGCVRSGYCVMAVATRPTVEITVNRNAARQSDVDFTRGFLLLISEI